MQDQHDLPPTGARLVRALEHAGVHEPSVLAAFRRVPRERFVPPGTEDQAALDRPIRIGRAQVTTQPSLVGRMVTALHIEPSMRVLEVGTGFGYQAAILAELAPDIHSIERFPELAEVARANLTAAGYPLVEVVAGDGTLGHAEHAPFDAIVVAAAAPEVPAPLAGQLREGGRLVMPIGPGGDDEVIVFRRRGARLEEVEFVCAAHFVPLVGRHGILAG